MEVSVADWREWFATLDRYNAAHKPTTQHLGQNAFTGQIGEVIQHVEFPVVGNIEARRPGVDCARILRVDPPAEIRIRCTRGYLTGLAYRRLPGCV